MTPSGTSSWSSKGSDEAAAVLADLARDVGWWYRWDCGGERRAAAAMLEDGELPLLVALAGQPRDSASGKRRVPLYSSLLVATERRVIIAHKWPVGRLRTQQVRYEDVAAMHAEPDREEIVLVTPSATVRLCDFTPRAAESELIALLAGRLPRERVNLGARELPSQAWELTAPESYLLRYVEYGPIAIEAFKLALKELVARDALRLQIAEVPRKRRPGTKTVWLITDGAQLGSVTAPALTPVLELFRHARDRHSRTAVSAWPPHVALEGVLLTDFAIAAARRSHGFRDYLQRDVEGSLRDRGLLSSRGRLVGEPRHTVAGRRANEDLDRWLDEGKRLARRASAEEPARALDISVEPVLPSSSSPTPTAALRSSMRCAEPASPRATRSTAWSASRPPTTAPSSRSRRRMASVGSTSRHSTALSARSTVSISRSVPSTRASPHWEAAAAAATVAVAGERSAMPAR
jgi:hypothetical protein